MIAGDCECWGLRVLGKFVIFFQFFIRLPKTVGKKSGKKNVRLRVVRIFLKYLKGLQIYYLK